ncbi:MAG: 30S ribosomal protein S8 [Clostridia bacterium]|nr:30S ribosomal protein S8 [Clostridia bacterium]
MYVNDPIADMLTRIRNSLVSRKETVDIPTSKMKKAIADILLEEGYIKGVKMVDEGNEKIIRLTLKYSSQGKNVIMGLKRISSPGLRVYAKKTEVPKVLDGIGTAIISTSSGVMTDRKARELSVGGEVLAYIW